MKLAEVIIEEFNIQLSEGRMCRRRKQRARVQQVKSLQPLAGKSRNRTGSNARQLFDSGKTKPISCDPGDLTGPVACAGFLPFSPSAKVMPYSYRREQNSSRGDRFLHTLYDRPPWPSWPTPLYSCLLPAQLASARHQSQRRHCERRSNNFVVFFLR